MFCWIYYPILIVGMLTYIYTHTYIYIYIYISIIFVHYIFTLSHIFIIIIYLNEHLLCISYTIIIFTFIFFHYGGFINVLISSTWAGSERHWRSGPDSTWNWTGDEHRLYPPVNEQFDPGSHRGWKMSFYWKYGLFSGSNDVNLPDYLFHQKRIIFRVAPIHCR